MDVKLMMMMMMTSWFYLPWCRKRSACLGCGRVRGSVSTRKDAGARKGVGVELASVG